MTLSSLEHFLSMPVLASKYATAKLMPLNSRVTPQTWNSIRALEKKKKTLPPKLAFHNQVWRDRRWILKDSEAVLIIGLKQPEVSALER